jgi:glycosyltransferase involved in cell wall biosynthesis
MNILFVDQFSEMGGAQQCLVDLLPAIQARGWQAHVAAPGTGPLMDRVRSLGLAYFPLPYREYTSGRKTARDGIHFAQAFPAAAAHLRGLLRELSIDLLYVNGPRLLPAAAFAKCPIVFHAHSVVTQNLARSLATFVLRHTGANVMAVSEYAAAPFRASIPAARMHVIYNGVPDARRADARLRCNDGNPWRIGFIGRIAPEKGAQDFVRAARILTETRADLQFVICGAPVFSDIAYGQSVKAESRGLPVVFSGWEDDIPKVLRSLDLIVVPSASHDAAPRVILEAFSAGVPVVAYPSGGIPELVDSSAGMLVPESTPDSLATGITMLLDRPQQLRDMGIGARRLWADRFQVERYSDQVVAVLERVCPAAARTGETPIRQPLRPSQPRKEPGHIQTAAR